VFTAAAFVDNPITRHHAHATAPVCSSITKQSSHQNLVGLQQRLFTLGSPLNKTIISSNGIPHLLNLARWRDQPLAVQNRRDLGFAQRVALDGQ
jgi:hypothetical protein